MKPSQQTVFLIDDDEDVRDALGLLLRTVGFSVEAFPNALAFLERPNREKLGCIVADIRMPGLSGLQLLERLTAEGDRMPLVVITGHGDVNACRRAFKGGAVDFLAKPVDEQVLIEAVGVGFARLHERTRQQAERGELSALLARLTPREREVLDMVARGWATKEIARALDLSPRTVETHRANLAEKLGTNSIAELVRMVLADPERGAPP
ncbi:response regulator transcription factor [Microvirga alba]|uniref:Response regulator transcription factor n=1 Tax=Microvirga alba TaxID=2791025 RepID=A0A931FQF5_9HYPH|nr:response regulator [Microvirga alba]MBF9234577.1 response regulator transcription factor [Microvirga alba]